MSLWGTVSSAASWSLIKVDEGHYIYFVILMRNSFCLLITTSLQLERITITIWKVLKAQLSKHIKQLNWLILTNDWSAWPKWTNSLWHYLLLLWSRVSKITSEKLAFFWLRMTDNERVISIQYCQRRDFMHNIFYLYPAAGWFDWSQMLEKGKAEKQTTYV